MGLIFLRNRVTGAAFTPASLFSSGEEGAWYEPSPATCFTDTAGTTAASVGDAVARINDLSGNGNHATQATAAARPLLQQTAGGLYYLDFDGSDDGMATASIDFTATDKMSVFAGVEKESDAAIGQIVELSSATSALGNVGSFSNPVATVAGGFLAALRGDDNTGPISLALAETNSYPAPVTVVNTSLHDIGASNNEATLRINGTQAAVSGAEAAGNGNFGNYPLNIGARDVTVTPELFFNGKLFSLIVRGAASTAQEISDTESYVAAKTGVTIP